MSLRHRPPGLSTLPTEIIQRIYVVDDVLIDLESRLLGQAVCRSLSAALTGLLPCTLELRPEEPRSKLEWVWTHRPAVSSVVVCGSRADWRVTEGALGWTGSGLDLALGGCLMAVAGQAVDEVVCRIPNALASAAIFPGLRLLDVLVEGTTQLPAGLSKLQHLQSLCLEVQHCSISCPLDLSAAGQLAAITQLALEFEWSSGQPAGLKFDWGQLPALRALSLCPSRTTDPTPPLALAAAGSFPRSLTALTLGVDAQAAVVAQGVLAGPGPALSLPRVAASPWDELLPQVEHLRLEAGHLLEPAQLAAATALTRLEAVMLDTKTGRAGFENAALYQHGGASAYARQRAWAQVLAALPPSVASLGIRADGCDLGWLWEAGRALEALGGCSLRVLYLRCGKRYPPPDAALWYGLRAVYLEQDDIVEDGEPIDLGAAQQLEVLQVYPDRHARAMQRATTQPLHILRSCPEGPAGMAGFLNSQEALAAEAAGRTTSTRSHAAGQAAEVAQQAQQAQQALEAALAERMACRAQLLEATAEMHSCRRREEGAHGMLHIYKEELERVSEMEAKLLDLQQQARKEVAEQRQRAAEAEALAEGALAAEAAALEREVEARAELARLKRNRR